MARRGGSGAAAAAALVLVLGLAAGQAARAGLIISNDGSDLCNANLQDCASRCAAPQSFLFTCTSGGTFAKPASDCKCTTPPPMGVVTDGTAIMKMIQWPGRDACQGNTWLYDCAQFLQVQAVANNIQAQATDQASAMAAAAAAEAAAAAQAAALAAAQQMQQQQAQTQAAAATGGATVPGLTGVPGMAAPSAAGMGGGMGGGAPMMAGGAGMGGVPNSLMDGASMYGRRRMQQLAISTTAAASPSAGLTGACAKPITGLVTGAGAGVMVIPNFKGVASMATRGNDTMLVQLGGQGSQCVGAYKLMTGSIFSLGRTQAQLDSQAKASSKNAAGAAAAAAPATFGALAAAALWLLA